MTAKPSQSTPSPVSEKRAKFILRLLQLFFLLSSLYHLDAPFLSAHNERQNQTFDIARHVFREGWRAVLTPTVTFSWFGQETQRSTAVLQEVPFHGILAWPLVKLFGHERAATRLVSIFFALLSIELFYWTLRFWVNPAGAVLGAALWASSPLILHFGQVPMPDILYTAGILGSLLFALRKNLAASSGWFLFALLAKLNIIVFGLPILTSLLMAKQCRTPGKIFRVAATWGWLPLAGLAGWMGLLVWLAPPTSMSVMHIVTDRGSWADLLRFNFYLNVAGTLLVFGLGLLGSIGFLWACLKLRPPNRSWIYWSIILSNLVYFVFILRKVPEPQYFLPLLFWFLIPATIGAQKLFASLRGKRFGPVLIGALVVVHLAAVVVLTCDLKASRVPDFADIETAARLIPPDGRVIVVYRYYGAGPAVWLDRNVSAMSSLEQLEGKWAAFHKLGFDYVLLLDIDSRHFAGQSGLRPGMLALIKSQFQGMFGQTPAVGRSLAEYSNPAGPLRIFCDQTFHPLFAGPHLALYSIPPETSAK